MTCCAMLVRSGTCIDLPFTCISFGEIFGGSENFLRIMLCLCRLAAKGIDG